MIFNEQWILKETNHIRLQIGQIFLIADGEKLEGDLSVSYSEDGKVHILAGWEQPEFVQKSCHIDYFELWDKDGVMICRKPPDTPTDKVQGMNFWVEGDLGLIEIEAPQEGG